VWTTLPLMAVVFAAHVEETARTGLAQLPVFARWNPGDYPQVGGYRLETDSSSSGLEVGDRLIRLGDRDLRGVGYLGFDAIGLARTTPGHPVEIVVERRGERRSLRIEARPHAQRWSRIPILLLIPTVCVLLLLRAPSQPDVQRFYICFMTYAIGQAHFYGGPEWKTWVAGAMWTAASVLMVFFMLRFTRLFPAEMPESRRVPVALPWVAAALYLVFVRVNYFLAWPLPLEWVPRVSFALHASTTLIGIGVLGWNYLHAWPAGKRRLRWILLGLALGSLPVIVAGAAALVLPGWVGLRLAFAAGFLASVIWMMGAVLAVVRDNAFDVDRLIGATAAWSLAVAGGVAGIAIAVPAVSAGLSKGFGLDPTTTRLALAAVLGALVIPLGARLRPHVDRILFPGRLALHEGAAELADALARCASPGELLERASRGMAALFDARGVAIYTREGSSLRLRRAEGIEPPPVLGDREALATRVHPRNAPPELEPSAALVVPVRPGGRVESLVALGAKRSGDIYTTNDATILAGIAARIEMEWLGFQKRAADRESRAKTDLLAAASHDLRQPLHAVSLLSEALRDKLDDPEMRALAARIGESTHDLDEMLTGLLDRSKLDAGGVKAEVRDVALADVFAQLERDFELPAADRGVRLRIVPTRLAVRTDRLLMARILRNLVSNALRYAGAGASVLVGARPRGDRVVIEVRDSGPGIPQASQRRIFEAFQQLEGGARGGLGLGLSIVDGLARVLGHEVAVRSAPGRGATFSVSAARSRAAAPAPAASRAPGDAGVRVARRVLVVDDDARVRGATVAMLVGWGGEAREAASVAEAHRALRDGWRPDLVLADYALGAGETGLELVAALRGTLGEDLQAIVVTAETDPERIARIRASGLPVLRKPVKPASLRALLGGGSRVSP
jgi:signal transduction histidine kinase